MGRQKYKTEEERKQAKKEYYQKNREKIAEYHKTPMGRASRLVQAYKVSDKKYNRGKCTLTTQWVLNNIFNKPCAHCGKSGWQVIGCNRLDNNRPHTEDNVEPCCYECNAKLNGVEGKEKYAKQVYQYTKEGELVKVWESTAECGRNGYHQGNVVSCCNGNLKTYKGYVWSYGQ